MSESERAAALKEVQLELFALRQKYLLKTGKLKRKLFLIQGGGMKRCRAIGCASNGEPMPFDQFYKDDRAADGYYPFCRECKGRMARERYQRKRNVIARGRRSAAA